MVLTLSTKWEWVGGPRNALPTQVAGERSVWRRSGVEPDTPVLGGYGPQNPVGEGSRLDDTLP